MLVIIQRIEILLKLQLFRYLVNGTIATIVHFGVLQINIKYLSFTSAGLANIIAAIFGIFVSFVGSRYYVFQRKQQSVIQQLLKFIGIYILIAILHGFILLIWTDFYGMNYISGFLIGTIVQVLIGYWANKLLVFKNEKNNY